jgi:phosphomethylpyrimidine synthase
MTDLDGETDLSESSAAEVNLPPVGSHNTSRVPDSEDADTEASEADD